MKQVPKLPTRYEVASLSDIKEIEVRGYESFQPWSSVPQALENVAEIHAQRPALKYLWSAELDQAPQTWTYAELMQRVRRTANLLHSLGVDDKNAVAFLLPAIPAAYLALWGGETAGRVCPINYLLNAEHIAELLHAVNARVLIALAPCPELDLSEKIGQVQALCPSLQHILWVYPETSPPGSFDALLSDQNADALDFSRVVDRNSIAAYFHTGGTTGAPKLAQHTHGNQLHAACGAAQFYGSSERDVIINGFPLFHVAGSFVYGLSTLLSGGCVVLPTLLGMRNTEFVKRYWHFADRLGATLLAAVPTVISALLNSDATGTSTRSVRALFTGGSPLPDELAAQFERRFGIPVRNILGMTECAGVVSIEPYLADRVVGSCGVRLPFTEVCAIEGPSEEVVPLAAGLTGILALRGPNVGPGYIDQTMNAGTFCRGGWLVTGDIGHVDEDGRIFITGRAKDVIIRSGHNIDPGMIETALLTHPDVLIAAAVGEPDEYAGEVPVVFVSLRPGSTADGESLMRHATPLISERPAYPKRITVLAEMPVTAIGKIFKPTLRKLAIRRALQDRIDRAELSSHVVIAVEEGPRGLQVLFTLAANSQSIADSIAELMAPFPLKYSVHATA